MALEFLSRILHFCENLDKNIRARFSSKAPAVLREKPKHVKKSFFVKKIVSNLICLTIMPQLTQLTKLLNLNTMV